MEIRVFCYLKKKFLENCFIVVYDFYLICYEIKFRIYFFFIIFFEENFIVWKFSKLLGWLIIFEKIGDVLIEMSLSFFNELLWYMYNGFVIY